MPLFQFGARGSALLFAPPKTDHSIRSVAIGPATVALLEEQLAEHGEGPQRLVFHSKPGGYTCKPMADSWRYVRPSQPLIGDGGTSCATTTRRS